MSAYRHHRVTRRPPSLVWEVRSLEGETISKHATRPRAVKASRATGRVNLIVDGR